MPRVEAVHHAYRTEVASADELLARRGAELVLHGHNHRAMLTYVEGPRRPVPIVGVPSASLVAAHGRQTLARYNLYRIAPDPAEPIELIERGLTQPDGPIAEIGRKLLIPDGVAEPVT